MTLSLPNAPNGPLSLQGEGWGEGTEFIQTPTTPGRHHSRASSLLRRAPRRCLQASCSYRIDMKRSATHHQRLTLRITLPTPRPPFSAAAYNRSASAARYSSEQKVPSSTSSPGAPRSGAPASRRSRLTWGDWRDWVAS